MSAPLRIQAITLPVPDLAGVEKFYRWVLAAKPPDEPWPAGWRALGWGREDRIAFVDAAAEGAEEAVTVRLPAMAVAGAARWLVERNLVPAAVVVPPADADEARATWPESSVSVAREESFHNRVLLTLRGAFEPRIDLHVPLPAAVVASRGSIGPFTWRSEDWNRLEIPGILGVTTGAPDREGARAFLGTLGIEPLDPDAPRSPFRVGDHQWMLEERSPAGIYGIAVVMPLDRIKDLVRTLERLGAQHRHEKNHLLAADPAGRLLLVHGLKGG